MDLLEYSFFFFFCEIKVKIRNLWDHARFDSICTWLEYYRVKYLIHHSGLTSIFFDL
jgi:hypothetical protein